MIENHIKTEQMNAIKVLADTNLKISEAKGVLYKLQETETEYLVKREKKAMDRIQQNLIDSRALIDEVMANYKSVTEICNRAVALSDAIQGVYEKFEILTKSFDERNDAWEREIGLQQDAIAELKKQNNIESVKIENEKKNLKNKEKSLRDLESHLNSRQATLEKSYKIEKDLWNKLQQK